jgi:acyl-CoA thioester hydrolase
MMENAAPFVSRQRIYFDMLDPLGVMHNSRYLLLFERARFDLWHANGLSIGAEGLDWPYYVVRNEVNYHAPITRLQDVTVEVIVERLGTSSVTLSHQVFDDSGVCVADGKTVLVRVDSETSRPAPWSDAFRALLSRYQP